MTPARPLLALSLFAILAAAACAGRARVPPRELCADSDRGCNSAAECTWDETRQCTVCVCRDPEDAPTPGSGVPAVPGRPGTIRPGG